MADYPEKRVMDGADKIAKDIQARDRGDVDGLRKKASVIVGPSGRKIAPSYPKEYGKPIPDAEKLRAADAAEREHMKGNLYGGLGSEGYDTLLSERKRIMKENPGMKDANARLRK